MSYSFRYHAVHGARKFLDTELPSEADGWFDTPAKLKKPDAGAPKVVSDDKSVQARLTHLEKENEQLKRSNQSLLGQIQDMQAKLVGAGKTQDASGAVLDDRQSKGDELHAMTIDQIEEAMRKHKPPFEVDRRRKKADIIEACLDHLFQSG